MYVVSCPNSGVHRDIFFRFCFIFGLPRRYNMIFGSNPRYRQELGSQFIAFRSSKGSLKLRWCWRTAQ